MLIPNESEQAVMAGLRSMRNRGVKLASIAGAFAERCAPAKTRWSEVWSVPPVWRQFGPMPLTQVQGDVQVPSCVEPLNVGHAIDSCAHDVVERSSRAARCRQPGVEQFRVRDRSAAHAHYLDVQGSPRDGVRYQVSWLRGFGNVRVFPVDVAERIHRDSQQVILPQHEHPHSRQSVFEFEAAVVISSA